MSCKKQKLKTAADKMRELTKVACEKKYAAEIALAEKMLPSILKSVEEVAGIGEYECVVSSISTSVYRGLVDKLRADGFRVSAYEDGICMKLAISWS